tara:strand:- start:111691 stop:112833 length:1143 start_codon:yes stop_codon:yes gene_type:complete
MTFWDHAVDPVIDNLTEGVAGMPQSAAQPAIQARLNNSQLGAVLKAALGVGKADYLFCMIDVQGRLLAEPMDEAGQVSRLVLAQALNMVLFDGLLAAVPDGKAYCEDKLAADEAIIFDHGAIRTVDGPMTGELPRGYQAVARILIPLGFEVAGIYPLSRLKMTGRAFCHRDAPQLVAQFFVSELHVEQFSPAFGRAVANTIGGSADPLSPGAKALLDQLSENGTISFADATKLLPVLVKCFGVHHGPVSEADYETLLAESPEMAWISTEGNAFNHATDRVRSIEDVASEQRAKGHPMKESIEISSTGLVRQTAFKAARVMRQMRNADGELVTRDVPGSFYEFISRDYLCDDRTGEKKLDLRFDSSNAQGIFKMTAGNKAA